MWNLWRKASVPGYAIGLVVAVVVIVLIILLVAAQSGNWGSLWGGIQNVRP